MNRPLSDGVYTPVVTFFTAPPAQAVDVEAFANFCKYQAASGIAGITLFGSTGEAATLTQDERDTLTRAARTALDSIGQGAMPLISGIAPASLGGAIALAKQAATSGADCVLSLTPHFWTGAMTVEAIKSFYTQLADASPLPIIIYSYPQVTSGLELDSDAIGQLALHPNIISCKLTDHSVGKLARLGRYSVVAEKAQQQGTQWTAMGGASDYLVGALSVGASGCISGAANVLPRMCAQVYNLYKQGKIENAQKMQAVLADAEWAISKSGLPGTKYLVSKQHGLKPESRRPREPVPPASDELQAWLDKRLTSALEVERALGSS